MIPQLVEHLRCPATGSPLKLQVIRESSKNYNGITEKIIEKGILWSEQGWFYPVINGIPRLTIESILEHDSFYTNHIPGFLALKKKLVSENFNLINSCVVRNKRTKESFALEWSLFNYESDKTWDADRTAMVNRFLKETDETILSIKNKIIFDVGCGNGLLDQLIAKDTNCVIAMDLSRSIERAYEKNQERNVLFIQGDVYFPPIPPRYFDIVHSSGVIHHTPDTFHAFSCLDKTVKNEGKVSIWLYHPRKNIFHRGSLVLRRISSKWPVKMQFLFYKFTLFPIIFIIKKIKGTSQNSREMMVDIMDSFSPEYRHEHTHEEAIDLLRRSRYKNIKITTTGIFGFNIIGNK